MASLLSKYSSNPFCLVVISQSRSAFAWCAILPHPWGGGGGGGGRAKAAFLFSCVAVVVREIGARGKQEQNLSKYLEHWQRKGGECSERDPAIYEEQFDKRMQWIPPRRKKIWMGSCEEATGNGSHPEENFVGKDWLEMMASNLSPPKNNNKNNSHSSRTWRLRCR